MTPPIPIAEYDARSLVQTLANNANVTSWTDASGNGNNISGGSVTPPKLQYHDTFNGAPCVRFVSGSSEYLTCPYTGPIGTIIAVYALRATGTAQALCGVNTSVNGDGALYIEVDDGAGGLKARRNAITSTDTVALASHAYGPIADTDWTVGPPASIAATIQNNAVNLYRQGFLVDAYRIAVGDRFRQGNTSLAIGARYLSGSLAEFAEMDLYHFRVYREALTPAEIIESQREMSWMLGGPIEPGDVAGSGWLEPYLCMSSIRGGDRADTQIASYQPNSGGYTVRDSSIRWMAGRCWMAHTDTAFTDTTTFGAGVSNDGRFFLRLPAVTPTRPSGVNAGVVWSPEWIDGREGLGLVMSMGAAAGDKAQVYYPATQLNYLAGVSLGTGALVISALSGDLLDSFADVDPTGGYALYFRNASNAIARYRGTELGGASWTLESIGVTWATSVEAPCVLRFSENHLRLYVDYTDGSGVHFVDSFNNGTSFGPIQTLAGNDIPVRHGTFIIWPDPRSAVQLIGIGSPDRDVIRAAATVTITPAQANSSNPRYSTRDMANLAQGSAPTDVWTFNDPDGDPINLSGKDIRLVFATVTSIGTDDDEVGNDPVDDTIAFAFKYETDGDGLTVGGADNNQVTLVHDATKLATAGDYRFFWWQTTDNLLLAKGSVSIEPTVLNAT